MQFTNYKFIFAVCFIVCKLKHNKNCIDREHCVTESMDWTMGLWFENVTYLDEGPQDIMGCTGAYSFFYVEQSYLGHHGCMQNLPSNKTQTTNETNDAVMQEEQQQHVNSQIATITSEKNTAMLEPEPA